MSQVQKDMVAIMATNSASHTNGDDRFTELVIPQIDLLYRTAWSLSRSKTDADDLVQETLLRAYRAIDRFDGRYPKAWLLTIMRNANINRARKKTPDLLEDPDITFERSLDFADTDGPEEHLIDQAFDAVIDQAFEDLPDKFRAVVELVDINGLPYQQAADLLDIPVGTVMSRLHRGRKRIREHIATTGLDVSGAFRDINTTGDAAADPTSPKPPSYDSDTEGGSR